MRDSEDLWTPFKDLQSLVEGAILKSGSHLFELLRESLNKNKQNLLNPLKNPPKNAKNREELLKSVTEGITLPGIGHEILPQELVDEAIIISDMYNLNEYYALDLLCTASRQMPNHPGLTRGLVAVLLYYDGRKALVNALQALIQARAGLLWATDSLPQVTEFITAFTDSLVADGLLENIIGILDTLDLAREISLLQSNRALDGPKHCHQVTEIFTGIKCSLANIIYLHSAQSGLSKQTTMILMAHLQNNRIQPDADGAIDDVSLTLTIALLYALDLSLFQRKDNSEELVNILPLLSEEDFLPAVIRELTRVGQTWNSPEILALARLALGISLNILRSVPQSALPSSICDEDDTLISLALDGKVLDFLYNTLLLNKNIFKEEFYIRRIHQLITDLIALFPLRIQELRNRAEEVARTKQAHIQEGLEPPSNLPHHFEHLMLVIHRLYSSDPLDLQLMLDYWYPLEESYSKGHTYSFKSPPRQVSLFKFVRSAGDHLPPMLFVPYIQMLTSLASCEQAARHIFNHMKQNNEMLSWDHFFESFNRYYFNLRQELPLTTDTVYRTRSHPKGITPLEIQGLHAVLGLIKTVATHDDVSRVSFCEIPSWNVINVFIGLIGCSVQISLKAELLRTLAAFAKSSTNAITIWHSLEASQILTTVPTTSNYSPRGLQTELEELEARNEEFPLTRAMLELLDKLTDIPVPKMLGAGLRNPGFDPYLNFIMNFVFLRFNIRQYKNPAEKWEVSCSCMKLIYKLLEQYDPQVQDFSESRVEIHGGGSTCVNRPAGYHIMLNMSMQSELLKMVLFLVDEGCNLLDTFSMFSGKSDLEQSMLYCLKLLEKVLALTPKFLLLNNSNSSPVLLTPIYKLLMGINPRSGKPDHLVNITKYVTYNSWLPEHSLAAVQILLAMMSHSFAQSHLVTFFTATPSLRVSIRHGFVECMDSDDLDVENVDEQGMGVVSKTKEVILKLLIKCLNHQAPNLTHYLLGFDLSKDIKRTVFQQPGYLGHPRTCLHSLLSLLNNSLLERKQLFWPPIHPRLVEKGYHVLYTLCANAKTTEPVFRFLRSSNDFIDKHLSSLPFPCQNSPTILNQMSWLLKTVAIEIKVLTNNDQLSQVTHLLNLLTRNEDHVEPSQELTLDSVEVFSLSHDPGLRRKKEAEKKCLLRRLLNLLKFSHDSVQQPNWNYFEPSMLEKVINQCQVPVSNNKVKLINVKQLHQVLIDELSTVQNGSTVGQRQLILQEIEDVLVYALKLNESRCLAASTVQYFDAWRQVTGIIFAVAPLSLFSFNDRFQLLLEIMNDMLNQRKVGNVSLEMDNLASGVVLLLLVDARRNYIQITKSAINEAKKVSFFKSYTSIFHSVIDSIISWIITSGAKAQMIRCNLYGSLLNFLHFCEEETKQISARKTAEDVEVNEVDEFFMNRIRKLGSSISETSRSPGTDVILNLCKEPLFHVLCQDSTSGHDICRMLALSCLDLLVHTNPQWVSILSSRGFIKYLVECLLESDEELQGLLSPSIKTLRPLYVYEAKMALLCRIATTPFGAELILEQKALGALSALEVFNAHPDILSYTSASMDIDFLPSIAIRYLQLLTPALALCRVVLITLGKHNESAVLQVFSFILSHSDAIAQILRSGNPFLRLPFLKELAQITALIAFTTNQTVNDDLEYDVSQENLSHLHRIKKLMFSLVPRFVISDSLIRNINTTRTDVKKGKSEVVCNVLEVAGNLLMYVRNLTTLSSADRRLTTPVLVPVFNDTLRSAEDMDVVTKDLSLGVIVTQLVQCVAHYHRERANVNLLSSTLSSVPSLTSTALQDYLPEGSKNVQSLEELQYLASTEVSERLADKKLELSRCLFIIEHCFYLIWSHLDYYMLRAIPSTSYGISLKPSPLPNSKTPKQMSDITWNVSINEIRQLKEGLTSIFNETFCKSLVELSEEETSTNKGFIEALLRRLKKLLQFVPEKPGSFITNGTADKSLTH